MITLPVDNSSECADQTESAQVAKLAAGATIALSGKILGRAVHTLTQILVARSLGPSNFGLYALGWTILNIVASVTPLGLENGVIRFGSHERSDDAHRSRKVVSLSLVASSLTGVIAATLLYFVAPWLATAVFRMDGLAGVLQTFALALPFLATLRVASGALRAAHRVDLSMYSEEIGQPVAHFCLVAVLVLLGIGLKGITAAAVVANVCALSLALILTSNTFRLSEQSISENNSVTITELVKFSVPTAFAGVFSLLMIWTDRLLIGHYLPASDVGIYQAVSQAAILFSVVLTAINAIFAPMIANLYHSGQMAGLDRTFKVSTRWGLYVCLPLFLTLCVFPKELLSGVFGPEYTSGELALVVLSIAQIVNVGTGAVGYMLIMTGHQKLWLGVSAASLAVNILLNITLIPKFGVLGAAVATGCAVGVLFITGLVLVRTQLSLWPYDGSYLKGVKAALWTLLGLTAFSNISSLFVGDSLLIIVSAVLTAHAIFGGVLFVLGAEPEDRSALSLVLGRLTRRTT